MCYNTTGSISSVVSSIQANSNMASTAVATLSTNINTQATTISTLSSNIAAAIATVNSTATMAIGSATANAAIFGTLSAQVSQQLPFTGPAASVSQMMSAISSLGTQLSMTTAALSSLESHSQSLCTDLCGNGDHAFAMYI